MKTLTLLAAAAAFVTTSAFACDESSSDVAVVDRATSEFYGLIINVPANVILTQGEKSSVKIEGRKRETEKIEAKVVNGALVIDGKNNVPVNVYVNVEEINYVEVNGNAKVFGNQVINSDILVLKVNGSGSIRMDVRTLSLAMLVKGNGKIIASGTTGDSYTRIFGKGKVLAQNLDSYRSREEILKENTSSLKSSDKAGRKLTLRLTH